MEVTSQTLAGVWEAIEAYLAAEQIELDDLDLIGRGRTRTLRLLIDGTDLDLDRISEVARGVSRLLDSLDAPALEGSYQLEVSSPGLERRLNRPRHFQKSIGREVVVKTADGQHRGTIVAADDELVSIAAGDTSLQLSYPELLSARTVFTWEKPPKPGQRSK